MNTLKYIILFIIFLSSATLTAGDEFCGLKNTSYTNGEQVTMTVFYSTMGMYVPAGEATFSVALEKFNGRQVWHCKGVGKSYSFFDNFYKVRDRYESYIDTVTLLPVKFIRNVQEGGRKIYNNVTFNHNAGTATSTKGVYKITRCIQDVVSAMYYARNINFGKYKVNDKIPFDMFLDDEIHYLYLRYVGKEVIKTRFGTLRSIKLKPMLVKGTMFEGGEKMMVWVSDDPNHLVLRVESPITVGSIKVDMMSYKNLRYKLTSLVSTR